jgi:signal transduction histidine kinase
MPPILDEVGLQAALEWQAWEFQERTGIACVVEQGTGEASASIEMETSTAVFRIFQEIMNNLALRSGIARVEVEVRLEEEGLIMTVGSDGDGIEQEDLQRADPLSFAYMCEYAGKFGGEVGIIASREKGNVVVVRVPV